MSDIRDEAATVSKLRGVILGSVIGDAIGLPREGLSRRRAARLFGGPPLGHRFVFGRGMMSDDGEHASMVAQALLASNGEPAAFAKSLSWKLRWWLLCLPAGVGKATALSILKLWIGFPARRSGIWSAGNGPAMRATVIGAYAADDPQLLRKLVHASTVMTHRDPTAEDGAMAIALAAACAFRFGARLRPDDYIDMLRAELAGSPLLTELELAARDAATDLLPEEFFANRKMGRGVSGYIVHTVIASVFCWLRNPTDYQRAVEMVVCAGGDADSTGAIVGGLVGVTAGVEAIPAVWRHRLLEWPRTENWMCRLGEALSHNIASAREQVQSPRFFWPGLLARNIFFLAIVVIHGIRRALPPY